MPSDVRRNNAADVSRHVFFSLLFCPNKYRLNRKKWEKALNPNKQLYQQLSKKVQTHVCVCEIKIGIETKNILWIGSLCLCCLAYNIGNRGALSNQSQIRPSVGSSIKITRTHILYANNYCVFRSRDGGLTRVIPKQAMQRFPVDERTCMFRS